MGFAESLRDARERKEMSQADLARASGLTRAVISKWEMGLSERPSAHALQAVADVLEVPAFVLLMDWDRKDMEEKQKKAERDQKSGKLFDRLYITLKNMESAAEHLTEKDRKHLLGILKGTIKVIGK